MSDSESVYSWPSTVYHDEDDADRFFMHAKIEENSEYDLVIGKNGGDIPNGHLEFSQARDNHTLRHKGKYHKIKNPEIEYEKNVVEISKNKELTCKTELDDSFDLDSIKPCYRWICDPIILKKKCLWKVEDILEEKSIKKKTKVNYCGNVVKTYELPIIRQEIKNKIYDHKPKKWFWWKGKKYDTRILHDNNLVPICKLPENYTGLTGKISINGSKLDHCKISFAKNVTTIIEHNDKEFKGKVNSFDIDLGKDTFIKSIGTKGEAYDICSFPSADECKKESIPNLEYVKYAYNNRKTFITKYKLFYKLDKTNTWINFGMLKGNNNRYDEVKHDLGITARKLRIVPLSWSIHPFMQILLYGNTNKVESNTVEYQIEIPSRKKYHHKRIDHFDYPLDESNSKHVTYLIKEGMDFHYNENIFDSFQDTDVDYCIVCTLGKSDINGACRICRSNKEGYICNKHDIIDSIICYDCHSVHDKVSDVDFKLNEVDLDEVVLVDE
jgi:hypothetical protein